MCPKLIPGQVTFNWFCEYHGKSLVDGHFGVLSRALKDLENKTTIKTIKDLKEAFQTQEEFCQESRLQKLSERTAESNIKDGQNEVFFIIYEGDIPDVRIGGNISNIPPVVPAKSYFKLHILGLKIYLCLVLDNNTLFGSPISLQDA